MSGSLKISEKILKIEYRNKKYIEINPLFKIIFFLNDKKFNIRNSNNPSSPASYIWEGCLANVPALGNTTPQGKFVDLPNSSPLMKFEILPKNNPTGAAHAMISK